MNTQGSVGEGLPEDEWVTRAELAHTARISVSTAKRWASKGIGPRPHKLSPQTVRYRRDEVKQWMSSSRLPQVNQ